MINTGGKLVLIDTGSGPGAFKQTKGELGQLPQNLAAAGIDAKTIDTVVISHFHGDHVNGLLDAEQQLAFPNAEILVPEAEWKFWMDDGEMSRASKGRMEDLFKNNRRIFDALGRKVTPYEWDKELVPGITAGRRPPATASATRPMCVASGAAQLYVQSDVTNNPDLFARNPDWRGFFDQDPAAGGGDAPQGLRHAGGREDAGAGLPLSVPGLARVEKAGQRLSRRAGAVASDA